MSEVRDWNAVDTLNTDLDGYALSNPYQHVTRALMGAIKRRFEETVSVKDFGAVGDGTTDDAEAFQAAATAAAESGKSLFIPAGTFLVNGLDVACDVAGEGPDASVLKGAASSGAVVTLKGSGRKSIFGIGVQAASGQNGVSVTGAGRTTIENCKIRLLGAGIGLHAAPTTAVTRLLSIETLTISGAEGSETIGMELAGAVDSRIHNCEIMACQQGIVTKAGTNVLLLSDVHIWCGDMAQENTSWWNGTKCIFAKAAGIFLATNLYLDTARYVIDAQQNVKFYITNLKYADDGKYSAEVSASAFVNQSNDVAKQSVFRINGGVVDASKNLKDVFGINNNIVFNNVVATVPAVFAFEKSNHRVLRSYESGEHKTIITAYFGSGSGSKYTPIAFIYGRYAGESRYKIQDTLNGIQGELVVKSNNSVSFYGTTGDKLFYSYDSSAYLYTIYVQHTSKDVIYIDEIMSGENHFRYLHENLYVGSFDSIFEPQKKDSDDGLTEITAEE